MTPEQFTSWLETRSQTNPLIRFNKPLLMGIVNITADSFYDGNKYLSRDKACEHAARLIEEGADIIDIGGESSRPGAEPLSLDEELARVIPVIEAIRKYSDVSISIDTYKPAVMQAAVQAGANCINDIYALRNEGAMEMAAQLRVPVCLMHMQGHPKTMQQSPNYANGAMPDVMHFFSQRIQACEQAGIARQHIILDPGFGFGKKPADNLNLMYNINKFSAFNLPILLGVSRKSTLGVVLNKTADQRLIGSIALAVYAALEGVGILRVHDVDETGQAMTMIKALFEAA